MLFSRKLSDNLTLVKFMHDSKLRGLTFLFIIYDGLHYSYVHFNMDSIQVLSEFVQSSFNLFLSPCYRVIKSICTLILAVIWLSTTQQSVFIYFKNFFINFLDN